MKRLAAIALLALPFPALALEQSHICHEDSDCIWVKGYVEPTDLHPGKTLVGCVHKNTRLKENE